LPIPSWHCNWNKILGALAFYMANRDTAEDQRQIAEALLNPPEPTPALKKAFQQRRELLGVE
jgi:hypothetical protein